MAAWPSDSLQLCKHPDSHGPYYGRKMCCNPVIFSGAWNLLHQLFGPLAQMIFLYCPFRWEGAPRGPCGRQGGGRAQKGVTETPKRCSAWGPCVGSEAGVWVRVALAAAAAVPTSRARKRSPNPLGLGTTCHQQRGRRSLAGGRARRAMHTPASPRARRAVPAAGSERHAQHPRSNPGPASAKKKSWIITTFVKKARAPPSAALTQQRGYH